MNKFYGIRVDEAFKSGRNWFEINAYGGRMFFRWGIVIIVISALGMALPDRHWLTYAYLSFLVLMTGLAIVVLQIFRYATGRK